MGQSWVKLAIISARFRIEEPIGGKPIQRLAVCWSFPFNAPAALFFYLNLRNGLHSPQSFRLCCNQKP
jgi:hypothetical protein